MRSRSRLPSYSSGGPPLRASTALKPRRAATAETARQQLDWRGPQVIRVSARWAMASPTRNSSLRILLPVSRRPVRSSRLIHSSTPSSRDRRSSLSSGVGVNASSTRGIGTEATDIIATISGEQVRWQGIGALGRRRLTEETLHHERVAHRVVPVVVVEQDEDLVRLDGQRLRLRGELAKLGLRVKVVVLLAHGGLLTSELTQPPLRAAPVQPEHRGGCGGGRDAGHGIGGGGRVDDDVAQPGPPQRLQRLPPVVGKP